MTRTIRAPRGADLSCRGWQQEAALRMLMNNLDPQVAEAPDQLIVYGGTGRAARSWACYDALVNSLRQLGDEETLLVQSGKPVGVFPTHDLAPRVIIANSMLVPAWANWETFRELERQGLTMYGQMTAGSWIYIGTQGILQGTYETFAELARQHYGDSLKGRWVLSAGLGGMGGAQPLAVTMNEGVALMVEVDARRAQRRVKEGFCDRLVHDLDEGLRLVNEHLKSQRPVSVALVANAATVFDELLRRGVIPDVVTDQTSAHDALEGYVPEGMSLEQALQLRGQDPEQYVDRALQSMHKHCESMVGMQERGAVAFDYGNNLRGQAQRAGYKHAFAYAGFVPAYIRPMFCEGRGPFRWVALSGNPEDILVTDEVVKREFSDNTGLCRWIDQAQERVPFQGLPARVCWLGQGERAHFGRLINELVRKGTISAPVVIGRDHLDCGSVASPYRETEAMRDGSDAVADWPLLNALLNAVSGASWVSVHHGGGVGIGLSLHAGMVVVADGTRDAQWRLERVLHTDPGMGVIRHADAGYEEAYKTADTHQITIPMKQKK